MSGRCKEPHGGQGGWSRVRERTVVREKAKEREQTGMDQVELVGHDKDLGSNSKRESLQVSSRGMI